MFESKVQSSSVKFQVCHPMVKSCYNVLAGNIFIMELREEFSVCRNNEVLSGVFFVNFYKAFYSRERENAKLRETKLSENRE